MILTSKDGDTSVYNFEIGKPQNIRFLPGEVLTLDQGFVWNVQTHYQGLYANSDSVRILPRYLPVNLTSKNATDIKYCESYIPYYEHLHSAAMVTVCCMADNTNCNDLYFDEAEEIHQIDIHPEQRLHLAANREWYLYFYDAVPAHFDIACSKPFKVFTFYQNRLTLCAGAEIVATYKHKEGKTALCTLFSLPMCL